MRPRFHPPRHGVLCPSVAHAHAASPGARSHPRTPHPRSHGHVVPHLQAARPCAAGTLVLSCLAALLTLATTLAQPSKPAAVAPSDPAALGRTYPSVPHELRGVWATHSAEPDWDTAMAYLAEAHINAVFPYFASAGACWYPSRLLPSLSGCDFAAEAADAGLRHGVAVHARMLGLYAMGAPDDFRRQLHAEGRFMISDKGKPTRWLCPTSPANRQLLVAVARELAWLYPFAGLQLDYIRFPGEEFCFCPRCRKEFERTIGHPVPDMAQAVKSAPLRQQFLDWRRSLITGLVQEISRAVREIRPDMLISAAVLLNWEDHRDGFAQDWKDWADQGLVDFLCPMDYTPDNARFELYVRRQAAWLAGRRPFCPGIGVHADGMTFGGPQMLLDQITLCRNLGASGWVIFNYSPELVSRYLPALPVGTTSTRATFPTR